jgi:amino acid transporter
MSTGLLILVLFHTAISLIAISAGIVVVKQLLAGHIDRAWTKWFLAMAIATSVTGYFFPFIGVTPAQIVGVIALVILALVLVAIRNGRKGAWRWIYAMGSVASLYLLCFVLVVQSFKHMPFLTPLAPTGSEPPFQITQLVVLALFIALGIGAVWKFRPALA